MRTQDQKRAQKAYQTVSGLEEARKAKFKTYVLKFPAMVLQCGLLPTLAFFEQKEKGIYSYYDEWLKSADSGILWGDITEDSVRDRLCSPRLTVERYRFVAREALAYGTWLKRAAEALLGDLPTED